MPAARIPILGGRSPPQEPDGGLSSNALGVVPLLDYGCPYPGKLPGVLFLCTNLPYFASALALGFAWERPLMGLAMSVMGFVSSGFHFHQTTSAWGENGDRIKLWLKFDMGGAALIGLLGLACADAMPPWWWWPLALLSVLLLWRSWWPSSPALGERSCAIYSAVHGAWHWYIVIPRAALHA